MGRIPPLLPARAMQTYSLVAPLATHWRDATCTEINCTWRPGTCADVGCTHYLNGWQTRIDESAYEGQLRAYYIRRESGRAFTEYREGALTVFVFEAGQPCFRASEHVGEHPIHKIPLERDPLPLVRPGDWRGYGAARIHRRAEDWIEDMQESLDKVRDRQQRG